MKKIVLVPIFILLFVTVCFAGQRPTQDTGGIKSGEGDFTEFHDPFDQSSSAGTIEDPLEPLNRAFFWFNDKLYTGVLAPLCRAVSPELRNAVAAVYDSLDKPLHIGGTEFKFAFRDGGSEIGRFLVDSLVDLLHHGQPENRADQQGEFARALDTLGIGSGFYLVLPVFGPSNLRDGLMRLTSFYFDPTTCLETVGGPRRETAEKSLLGELTLYENIRRHSLDPYLFFRNAYAQHLAGEGKKSFFSLVSPRSPSLSGVEMESILVCSR